MTFKVESFRDRFFEKLKGQKFLLHGLCWLFYFSFIGLLISISDIQLHEYFGWLIINAPFKLAIFYAFYYYLIPRWLGKKTGKFIKSVVLLLLIYPPVKYSIDSAFGIISVPILQIDADIDEEEAAEEFTRGYQDGRQGDPKRSKKEAEKILTTTVEITRRVATPIGLILVALFGRFTVDWFRSEKKRTLEEQRRLEGELAMLRNQVNPHFLFNVLNNIDTMVYKTSPEASEAIYKLSSIMRYMLYESDAPKVSVEKEIEYLESYMDLQKTRMREQDNIQAHFDNDCPQCQVVPMLFIAFVENAFKHVSTVSKSRNISVELVVRNKRLYFRCTNSFDENRKEQKDKVGGIGLVNVRRRLELLYPTKHKLKVFSKGLEYIVSLELDLD